MRLHLLTKIGFVAAVRLLMRPYYLVGNWEEDEERGGWEEEAKYLSPRYGKGNEREREKTGPAVIRMQDKYTFYFYF